MTQRVCLRALTLGALLFVCLLPIEAFSQTGACCIPDAATGTCQILSAVDCEAAGGVYQGDGTVCLGDANGNLIDDICEEPPGACCFDDGSCVDNLNEADCKANGGHYQGDGTQCADVDCGSTPGLKWFQPPDLSPQGMDVSAYYNDQLEPYVLATDFLCTSTGPITEIHIFGSWYHDILPMGDPRAVSFTLSLHTDIPDPDGTGPEYSMPGNMICYMPDVPFDVKMYASNLQEGWLEPPDNYDPNGDKVCWEYIFYLDGTCIQEGTPDNPIVYWIDLQAYPQTEPGTAPAFFGWKTAEPPHWNDDAVWAIGVDDPTGSPPWNELGIGTPGVDWRSLDLALAVYGTEVIGACCDDVTGLCRETTQSDCLAANGETYQGDGTTCATTQCPQPQTGACCYPDGSCVEGPRTDCDAATGGVYQGDGSSCTPNPCPQPTGACCNDVTGLCRETTSNDCLAANYETYQGDGTSCATTNCPAPDTCTTLVLPGVDLWTTPSGGSSYDSGFSSNPIPADFFGPGADPFTQPVTLEGKPLTTALGTLGSTDAIVKRLDAAPLPTIPSSHMVKIEIIALSLKSVAPITVTYNGGQNPEQWDLQVCLSSLPQDTGQMTITRECCNGGTYTATLPVLPKMTFTRVSNPSDVRVLDFGVEGYPAIQFSSPNGVWTSYVPPPFSLDSSDGTDSIDPDCDGSGWVPLPPTSNFRPGLSLIPCDPTTSGPGAGKVLTVHQALLAAHSVLPPQIVTPPDEGACCLPDGTCVLTTVAICSSVGGTHYGAGSSCFPDPCGQTQTGACCDDVTGACTITSQADCGSGHTYQGDGTTCDPNPCPQPPTELKWEQLPDLSTEGMDVAAYYHDSMEPYVLANDFLCTSTGPITEIHIFGSWYHDLLPMGDPSAVRFTLSLHTDIPDPDGDGPEYSMPGEMVCYMPDMPFEVNIWASNLREGWLTPPDAYDPDGDTVCWLYTFYLDGTCIQEGTPDNPIVYWIDLQAYPQTEPGTAPALFGWKTAIPPHWNDDAVWGFGEDTPTGTPQWNELGIGSPGLYIPGDLNGDGLVNQDDVDYFQAWLFGGGPPPVYNVGGFYPAADVTGDCNDYDVADLTLLVSYVQGLGGTLLYCPEYPPGGDWRSLDLAMLIYGPPSVTTGACCDDVTGACTVTTPANCGVGFTYQGDGTSCNPNPCPQPPPTGACCNDATGACTVTTQVNCGAGYTYQGDGTNCNPNPCPQPPQTGACCEDATGVCIVTTAANCSSPGLTYQGDGTNCNPNPCPTGPQTGACCLDDGTCVDLIQADCIGVGGTYQGDGSQCVGDNDGNGIDDACEDITWLPGDPHKMHFPQLPDERGWDVLATSPQSVADDWQCIQTGWVRDIHFWGSWMDGITGKIELFRVRIYSDIPVGPAGPEYSRPGELLWERDIDYYLFRSIDPPTLEGWYDPAEPVVLPDNHQEYFQYDILLDSLDWFYQDSGTIYWLEIEAVVTEAPNWQWGWKSSLDHFNDNAVFQAPAAGTGWNELRDPSPSLPEFDMAFVITGSCCNFPTMGDVDCNQEGPDIGDITEMITILFINVGAPWCCEDEAELDLTGLVDIGDLTIMISKLFITLTKLPPCPH